MLTYDKLNFSIEHEYEKLELEFLKKELAMLGYARNEAYKQELKNRSQLKLKKHYIIRESDVKKISLDIRKKYTVSFEPLTKNYFAQHATFFYLKGKKYIGDQYAHYDYPADLLKRITTVALWNIDYADWLVRYNDAGEMVIRAGLRQPESKLGLVTFDENN